MICYVDFLLIIDMQFKEETAFARQASRIQLRGYTLPLESLRSLHYFRQASYPPQQLHKRLQQPQLLRQKYVFIYMLPCNN